MNVLAGHFSGAKDSTSVLDQADLRAQGLLAVALYDFDISVIMRPGTQSLPWQFGTEGLLHRPKDLYQGAHQYNPYAFDVACMGNLLLAMFNVCVTPPSYHATSSLLVLAHGSTGADAGSAASRHDFTRPLCSFDCPGVPAVLP